MKGIVVHIGTHWGQHHADDAMATHMVEFIVEQLGGHCVIHRTREQGELDKMHVILDVGGAYTSKIKTFDDFVKHIMTFPEHETVLRLDHHQNTFKEKHDDEKTKLSATGIVFKILGEAYIERILKENNLVATPKQLKQIVQRIYNTFIRRIDSIDNHGKLLLHESQKGRACITTEVARMNPIDDDDKTEGYRCFVLAMERCARSLKINILFWYNQISEGISANLISVKKALDLAYPYGLGHHVVNLIYDSYELEDECTALKNAGIKPILSTNVEQIVKDAIGELQLEQDETVEQCLRSIEEYGVIGPKREIQCSVTMPLAVAQIREMLDAALIRKMWRPATLNHIVEQAAADLSEEDVPCTGHVEMPHAGAIFSFKKLLKEKKGYGHKKFVVNKNKQTGHWTASVVDNYKTPVPAAWLEAEKEALSSLIGADVTFVHPVAFGASNWEDLLVMMNKMTQIVETNKMK